MQLSILKSKLHLAAVTRSELNYHGSLTVDPFLMEAAGLLPYEEIGIVPKATIRGGGSLTLCIPRDAPFHPDSPGEAPKSRRFVP
jgi:hypothetical protein